MSNHPDANPEYAALVERVLAAEAGYREFLLPPEGSTALAFRKRISVQLNRKVSFPLACRNLKASARVVRFQGSEGVMVQVSSGRRPQKAAR